MSTISSGNQEETAFAILGVKQVSSSEKYKADISVNFICLIFEQNPVVTGPGGIVWQLLHNRSVNLY